ncbi:MAG TPA: hypothetical protein VNT51_10530, partial [Miltoncostaeaceae bacterium]|nr:hypothetical protein [Miltoncostaeaceae bacterium]
ASAAHAVPRAVAAPRAAARRRPAPRPARMLVFSREHTLVTARSTVPAGRLILQLRNIGEDGHDLAIRDARGRVVGRIPEIAPGTTGALRVTLRPGRHLLVCTLPGHEHAGMTRAFRVTRGPR